MRPILVLTALLAASSCFALRERGSRVEPLERHDLHTHEGPHRVGLADSGWDALLLRVALIRGARRTLDLQTFIWTEDEVGKLLGGTDVAFFGEETPLVDGHVEFVQFLLVFGWRF